MATTSISYFFCEVTRQTSRDPRTILCSLARQILNVLDETPKIGETLKSMFLSPQKEPEIQELCSLVASVVNLSTTSYLLIDGLDECDDAIRLQVLSCLSILMKNAKAGLKVLLTSRWMNIPKYLETFLQISLQSSRDSSDIDQYIRQMIDNKIEEEIIVVRNPTIADEIKLALIQKSDGMYVLSLNPLFFALS